MGPLLSLKIETSFDEGLKTTLFSPQPDPFKKLEKENTLENAVSALFFIKDSLNTESLEQICHYFEKLHVSTLSLKVHGMPINHRVFEYVYQVAKKTDAGVGGERWGEIHAFDDLKRLDNAIDLAAQEILTFFLFEQFKRFESPIAKVKNRTFEEAKLTPENKKAIDEFLAVFEKDPSKIRHLSLEERLHLIRIESPNFPSYKKKVIGAVTSARMHPLSREETLFALTGTTTQAALGIKKHGGLIPTGKLLKCGDAPLCGEVDAGIKKKGINQSHLSFVDIHHYETALEYALNKKFVFSKEKALQELNQVMKEFLLRTPELGFIDLLISLKLKFIRACLFADLSKESIASIQAQIKAALAIKPMDEECSIFIEKDLLPLIETLKPTILKPQEAALIYGEAYPLILGISKLTDTLQDKIKIVRGTDIRGEISIRGPLSLGDDIDFIISSDETVELIQELFEKSVPYPILSYSEALYILAKAKKRY